ncbi:MAG: PAS domain-containing protein, partial [Gammaproteobacteria bacterium]
MAMRSGTTRIRGAVRALLGALGRRPRSAGAATAALEAELAAVTARCERLEHALSFGEQVVYEWLPRTDTLSLSPNWYPLVGLPPGSTDSVGSFAGLVHPADRARAREAIVRALKHDEPHRVELRVRTQAHGERHMIVRGAVDRRDEHGRAERLLGTIVDVTERARSSERLALALNATHIGIGEWWPNGDRLALDESWYQLTGWPVGSVTSTAALATGAYIHPDDLETFGDFVEPVVSGRQDSNVTRYRMRLQSGEFRWVQASITAAERCPDGRAERIIGTVVDIHETADIETRLRVAVESGRQGLWQLQPQEDRLEPLTNWLELTGYDADEVTSMAACYAAGVIPPEDQPLVINEIEALTRGDRDETEIEFRIRRKSGEFFWALTRFLVSERDAAGQALRIVGVNIDITERRETEERLAVALETGRQATWSWDVASDRFEPDARWRRLFGDGQDQNETVRDLVQRIVHPDDRSRVEAITAASRSEGPDTGEAEFRLLGRDGRYLWVLLRTLVNARDAEGRPAHIVGTTVDITRLKEAEERTRRAAEAAQLGLWDWNLETDEVVFPDNLWPQLVGYPPERIRTAQDIVGIIHADDRASIAEAMAAITEGRYPSEWREVRYLRGDGTVMWVRVSGTVTERAPDGRPTRILGTSYDITDLKRTQQALEDERDRLELVIEGAEVGLWEYNFVSNGLRLNQRAATLFGEAVEDELRITLDDYTARIHDDDRAAFLGAIDEAVAVDGRFACDYRLRLPGDGWVWRHAAGRVSAWSEDGRPLRGAGTTIDVTERMERDAQLKTIADAMTRAPAGGLLQAAVRAASELCDSAPAFVGELDESGTGVSVIAAWPPDAGLEGLGYAIEATPCANVMDEDFCIYPERVAECFPEDAMLREMGVESYAGRRLVDERGRPNGMLIVYDTRPLANPDRVHSVLDILATTASNELARERSRRALIDSERRYRQIYERMPVLLCTLDQQQRVIDV